MTKPYQLLVANQTFVGFSRRPRRFKTVEPGFLPVFGKSASNTPAAGSAAQCGDEHTTTAEQIANQCELPLFGVAPSDAVDAPKPGVSLGGKPAFKLPEKQTRSETHCEARPAVGARGTTRIWEIVSGGSWRRRRRSVGPLAQGELGLTAVRVVRNDLSDADIEIVQAKRLGDRAGVQRRMAEHGAGSILSRFLSRFKRQQAMRSSA
ncbi:MAG: hypothetical protein QHJ82_01525 [Verrucomicrobiota bacterium]|nr:hypothetical protein [Verrucomicrobiota bacterium]